MRRVVASLLLGAAAGALSAFSHAVAGGEVGLGPLLIIVSVSALTFAALPGRWRGLTGTVTVLLAIQLVAHMWLEAVHPHGHGAPTSAGKPSAYGIAGAIEHALTPGMLMMWAHLLAVIVGASIAVSIRPLLERLLEFSAPWWWRSVDLPRVYSDMRLTHSRSILTLRPTVLAHVIEVRGPPVTA